MPQTIHFGRWFGPLHRRTNTYLKGLSHNLGLELTHAVMLVMCCIHEGIAQEALALEMAVDKAVIAKNAKWLETNGLIRREADAADGRVKRIFPTAKGHALKNRLDQHMEVWSLKLVEALTVEEQRHIFTALRKMALTATQVSIPDLLDEHGIPHGEE